MLLSFFCDEFFVNKCYINIDWRANSKPGIKMKKCFIIILLLGVFIQELRSQQLLRSDFPDYKEDSIRFLPKRPWVAATEIWGLNMLVWIGNRYIANQPYAYIDFTTIKDNFKTEPVWDTDMFSTNMIAHPYQGGLYYNAARSSGYNVWQSATFNVAGNFMWEYFMENEYPSINDMFTTTFAGVELGEISFRLSDLFIDDRSSGSERIGREFLVTLVSPMRGFNRLISGDSWKRRSFKGQSVRSVPVAFGANLGPRFFTEQNNSSKGSMSMQLNFHVDYGDTFSEEGFSLYDWFKLRAGFDFFSYEPLLNYVNVIGALWGKPIWNRGDQTISMGVFQHFDYYDSQLSSKSIGTVPPYHTSEVAALGLGILYGNPAVKLDKVDFYADFYLTGIALGTSVSDYMKVGERDYNMGSGYSLKFSSKLTYNKHWSMSMNFENYHIYSWKGYSPDLDLDAVDPRTFNYQGNKSNSCLSVLSTNFVYNSSHKWNIALSNRRFLRKTNYKYEPDIGYSTFDLMLSLGIQL